MTHRAMTLTLTLLLTVACGDASSDADSTSEASTQADAEMNSMASTSSSDVDEMARTVEAAAEVLAAARGGLDETRSYETIGDCVWSLAVSGTLASGTITAGLDAAPCGATLENDLGSVEVEITSGELAGTYVADGEGVWLISLSGLREATSEATGPRRSSAVDTTAEIASLDAIVDGEGVVSWSASVTYGAGLRDGWSLDVSVDEDGALTGTLSGPRGASCTFSGEPADVEIVCDEPAGA